MVSYFFTIHNLLIVFIFGRIAFKAVPGEPSGLIMEMHSYRMPSTKVVLRQTWFRTKDFIYIAFPFIIISGVVLKIMDIFGLLSVINLWLSPVTMFWLGLPPEVGLLLILGVLRKELFIVQLEVLLPVGVLLTPGQAITISILAMFYVPCIATIAVLIREFGYKKALLISAIEVGFAIFIAGIFSQVLRFIPFYF